MKLSVYFESDSPVLSDTSPFTDVLLKWPTAINSFSSLSVTPVTSSKLFPCTCFNHSCVPSASYLITYPSEFPDMLVISFVPSLFKSTPELYV